VLEAGGGRVQIPAPMLTRRWYELRVVASDGRLRFRQTALQRSWGVADSGAAEMPGTAGVLKRLALGAGFTAAPGPHDDPNYAFFNGRIEDPAIILEAADGDAPIEPERSEWLAWWDFSAGIATDRILDREHALNGSLRNLPTRAVRSSRWTGEETNWQHAQQPLAAKPGCVRWDRSATRASASASGQDQTRKCARYRPAISPP
jgi:N,N-dimethylformamidase